jgi:hypothetical protein
MSDINNTNTETTVAAKAAKVKTTVKKADLTVELLQQFLELREDGNFYWKVDTVVAQAGSWAGSKREADGYYSVVFKGTNYSGKQLAEFYKTGAWPVKAPAAAKAKAEAKPKVMRTPAVYTEEQMKAAKAELVAKKAAKKAEAEAKAKAEGASDADAAAAGEAAAEAGDEQVAE